jgi:orotidine-5'-phosphate decarboxylase
MTRAEAVRRLVVALDTPSRDQAVAWARALAGRVGLVKVGLELFTAAGPALVEEIAALGVPVFLDLKLHDIPNTVAGAARSVARLAPDFLTVHASGGAAMVRAAADALPDTRITAVTVLTSMSEADLDAVGLRGPASEAAVRLAVLAVDAGARAVVCSPQEVAAIRAAVPADVVLVTPGVRPSGAALGDQQRVATPEQALADGADLLVIGRPITGADDITAAAAAIAASLV